MQKNQGGEYTNIGWLFLALLPLIFIFLPYKKKYYAVFFMLLALIQIIFYATPNSKFLDNKTFGSFDESVLSGILVNNEKVFQNEKFNKDIYDIDVGDYSMQLVTNLIENSQIIEEAKQNDMSVFDYVDALLEQNKENLALTFYADLKEIVKNPELGSTINNF
jgi:hypothetical protein